jgi:hypothetical protein
MNAACHAENMLLAGKFESYVSRRRKFWVCNCSKFYELRQKKKNGDSKMVRGAGFEPATPCV